MAMGQVIRINAFIRSPKTLILRALSGTVGQRILSMHCAFHVGSSAMFTIVSGEKTMRYNVLTIDSLPAILPDKPAVSAYVVVVPNQEYDV